MPGSLMLLALLIVDIPNFWQAYSPAWLRPVSARFSETWTAGEGLAEP